MANNMGRVAVLAAGYLLGRSKRIKLVSMVAGAIAYRQLTANQNDQDSKSSGSLLKQITSSPEMGQVISGLTEAGRGALTAAASKGVESLNKNLQERSAALREENQQPERKDDEAQGESETDTAAHDQSDEETESEAAERGEDSSADAAESDDQEVTEPNEDGGS